MAWYLSSIASMLNMAGNQSSILGSHQRRKEEWDLRKDIAAIEVKQIEKQLIAAQIRHEIAKNELENHKLQTTQAKEIDEELRTKFTNKQLYDRMVSQLSQLYFRTYELAYDLAKQAERCYQLEHGLEQSNFIAFGYWDNLKKGLLSGEQLYFDLKRMETSYLERNAREYELTKHVSLLQVDPLALVRLRQTGSSGDFKLPEALFDMDGPGHYFRRIKNVAISIPCVTGPYTNVNCKLTLLESSIRKSPAANGSDDYPCSNEDSRFIDHFGTIESIVASSAQNDSGLFETNLRDERYLPYENTGVISKWRLELPANPNSEEPEPCQFNYDTISDVILHIRYTAREGGSILRDAAMGSLRNAIEKSMAAGMVRLFSIRHEFPTAWAEFQGQTTVDDQRFKLTINLKEEHYPFWSQGRLKKVTQLGILARSTEDPIPESIEIAEKAEKNDSGGQMDYLKKDPSLGNLLSGKLTNIQLPEKPMVKLNLFFNTKAVSDLWIAVTWGE